MFDADGDSGAASVSHLLKPSESQIGLRSIWSQGIRLFFPPSHSEITHAVIMGKPLFYISLFLKSDVSGLAAGLGTMGK